MTNAKIVILSIIAVLFGFTAIVLIFDIDFMRWLTCSSPIANQQDKNSDVCKRLDRGI